MGSSSQELFPMRRDSYGDARSVFYTGRNGSTVSNSSQDSLHKFRSMDTNFACFAYDSPTTTLSIGGDLSGMGREQDDSMNETILRLKTWSTAADVRQDNSVVDSGMGGLSQNSKGIKRKRKPTGNRGLGREDGAEGGASDGSSDGIGEEDSEGIVLFWGSAKGGSSTVDDLTSSAGGGRFDKSRGAQKSDSTMNLGLSQGLDQILNSGSPGGISVDYVGGSRVVSEDHGTLLQLGQTVGGNPPSLEGRVRGARSPNMSSVAGEGVHLGLAPAGGNHTSESMRKYATTLDGVPVVDEGSSSARMSKTGGGFMPALLMGSTINVNSHPIAQALTMQQRPPPIISFPEFLNRRTPEEPPTSSEQDLSMSIRASTSGGTTSTSGTSGLSDKASKVCKFRGCSKGARGASGLCIAHGGGQRCEKNGCNKGAEGRTVYCKAHGGGRRCQNLGCTKSAEGKTDYCIGHGGGRRCSHEGCDKAARGRSGLCIRHGGGKRCLTEGCTKSAEGYSGLCISHGGGRRCHFVACTKGAQGSTMFCKAHGGGKRCMIQGCSKGAEGSTPLCKGHGGGKRCMFDGGGICTKSVHGGTLYCVAHGGGKRCQVEGCTKSARGRTDFCVRHGGGKRCKVEACGKSAQGSTDFCKAHGGGKRCQWGVDGSGFGEPGKGEVCDKFARGKTGLCAAHSAQVQDRRVHGGTGLGPGLTPGLFRGLVSGSGQSRVSMGTSSTGAQGLFGSVSHGNSGSPGTHSGKDDSNTMSTGQFFSASMSNGSGNTSPMSSVGLGTSRSLVTSPSSSVAGSDLQRSNSQSSITPSFPAGFSIGQPLIPPRVLVPLSMQTKDTGSSRLNHGRPPRPPISPDGGFSMGARSSAYGVATQSEGRVHGGGLMAMLSREVNTADGPDSISLGIATSTSSQAIDVSWTPGVANAPTPIDLMEEGLQKQKQRGAIGADDVGQFLAARS